MPNIRMKESNRLKYDLVNMVLKCDITNAINGCKLIFQVIFPRVSTMLTVTPFAVITKFTSTKSTTPTPQPTSSLAPAQLHQERMIHHGTFLANFDSKVKLWSNRVGKCWINDLLPAVYCLVYVWLLLTPRSHNELIT